MIRMMETEIYVFCLEKDKNMVNSVLRTAEKKFSETVEEQLGTSILKFFNKTKKWTAN